MGHDLYQPPPPRRTAREAGISRRGLLRLGLTARARADIDFDGVSERRRAGWDAGGHEPWLRALEPVAGVIVEAAGVGPGQRVLDAAAGDGNVAAAALARGARVDACDFSAAMAGRGRVRCPGAAWRVADVQALPYEDGAFDAVLSSFGAMLAPRARRTVAELVRVLRPGGTLALTAWVPKGLPGRLDELLDLPEGVRPPADWGVQAVARRRLEPLLGELELRTRSVPLSFSDADAFFAALLRPECRAVDPLRPDLERLLASCNNGADTVEVDARYLLTVGRRA
jgi:SAM-dependent methyltransferase